MGDILPRGVGTPARTRPSWSGAFDSAAGAARALFTTCKIVVASLDDTPCRRERREGVSVRTLIAQATIEPKASEANLPTNHFGSDIAAAGSG